MASATLPGAILRRPNPGKRNDKEDAEQEIRQGGLRIHRRNARLAVQDSYRGDVAELLNHAREHQRPEARRIGSDHEKGDLPRYGDGQEAVKELRMVGWWRDCRPVTSTSQ